MDSDVHFFFSLMFFRPIKKKKKLHYDGLMTLTSSHIVYVHLNSKVSQLQMGWAKR